MSEQRPSEDEQTEREETVEDLETPEGQAEEVTGGKLVINGHENIS